MKIAIRTKTLEEFKKVLEIFEKKCWVWLSGDKPMSRDIDIEGYFEHNEDDTCLEYQNKFTFGHKDSFKSGRYKIISFKKFLEMEKAPILQYDNVVREEMIKCFKEQFLK